MQLDLDCQLETLGGSKKRVFKTMSNCKTNYSASSFYKGQLLQDELSENKKKSGTTVFTLTLRQ